MMNRENVHLCAGTPISHVCESVRIFTSYSMTCYQVMHYIDLHCVLPNVIILI